MRRRDEAAFAAFVTERQTMLRRRAYLLCGSWADGDELVQEALARVYVAWPRIAPGAETAYTRTTMMNLFLNDRRKKRREVLTDEPPEPQAATQTGPDRELALTLGGMLDDLPDAQRAVLVLRFWEDLTVPQIATATGVAEGTVKSQISRAVAALRHRLVDPPTDLATGGAGVAT
ncbi:RNA polymerase sigma factor [Terracoccus luteus]|jgi:RNA polymerase sigma-70 factor (sigma-E family)|uniref:RNA polymerase sigma-70 factor (Sigma-E family) n=1 Tax=Terracoccus luteus TaxID=53356 RepID=A0A495XVB1_9MICO|nr:SigE family RNA polymerase sigma factor [Terracoccus luteus]MBB2986696.1 RNA polymerase sigma-70 factor (sigma-E family) [Terracoccus luteus]MCP2172347.1 RNA polymerase sigma-70 factor (sigma-E family) [Terracoccus luteus]RKT76746.1 RNA polymerase sigma-70 factor (sigma-E family) [Terracoccus luteus]